MIQDKAIKILHVYASDTAGGAARTASRSDRRFLDYGQKHNFYRTNTSFHSIALPANELGLELQNKWKNSFFDLFHLNWLGDSTISIEGIGSIDVPIVWPLIDQWLFLGAEHYVNPPDEGESARNDIRFKLNYRRETRPSFESGPGINRKTWLRKARSWRKPIIFFLHQTSLQNVLEKALSQVVGL